MSTIIMGNCWPIRMPPVAKAVLVSLADNANDHGICWPSLTTICKRTCFGRSAVVEAIHWLEAEGFITADRSDRRHTKYRFTASLTEAPVRQAHQYAKRTSPPAAPPETNLESGRRTSLVRHADPNHKEPPRALSVCTRACVELRNAGVDRVNSRHPDLIALVEAGATPEDFGETAREYPGKGFAYILATIARRRAEPAPPPPSTPPANGARAQRHAPGKIASAMLVLKEKRDAHAQEGTDPTGRLVSGSRDEPDHAAGHPRLRGPTRE